MLFQNRARDDTFLRHKQLRYWSEQEAILHYLENYDRTPNFIEQEIAKSARKYVNVSGGERIYSNEDILFAFELISRSRSAYDFLSTYLKLPSTRLLRKFTAKIDSVEDTAFLKNIISSLEPKQRRCVVQIDEVYLRMETSYRGGEFYGFASSGKPAKTLLYFLLKFEFGGPILPFKYFPIATLNADDLMMYYTETRHVINESGGTVIAVITDNNRVNQRFLQNITESFHGELPLNDSVHLTKCLRNNWLMKGVINFEDPDDGTERHAKWCTLQNVYEEERGNLLKKSDLSSKSVFPKNIEKQSVPLALKVFSEKTYAAVLQKDFDSARFIQICCRFFRICNVRCINKDPSNFFEFEKEIRSVTQLSWLSAFAKAMNNSNISRDTRSALIRFVDNITHLCSRLLSSPDYEYVLLGRYQSDDVERLFLKLRQKVGGGYFITHQQASHATRIMLAKRRIRFSKP